MDLNINFQKVKLYHLKFVSYSINGRFDWEVPFHTFLFCQREEVALLKNY